MKKRISDLLQAMTLEEKASLCSGQDFWHLKGIDRLGIPSIMVTDGPHGLRKQSGSSDHVGLNASIPATCFPTAVTLASSWDRELIKSVGVALGEECQQENVAVLLGPGVNIKRSPLCGRNFEYFSEDPYLTGELAAAMIQGVQSEGVGMSLKHFAANNQESNRMTIDTFVDERTLREIYLPGFEKAVKAAGPWTVMCSYNRLNGTFVSEHDGLLNQVLREEWGYAGLVVTDWGATNDRVKGLIAGQDLEMPSSAGMTDLQIVQAVKTGELKADLLDRGAERILTLILRSQAERKENFRYDPSAHHQLARRAAAESAVLLKNDDALLPLNRDRTSIALIGEFAKVPRFQGAGSSLINPLQLETAFDAYQASTGHSVRYARGYDVRTGKADRRLIEEACQLALSVERVILMVGLTDDYESEGFDRAHIQLPDAHEALIKAVLKVNPNTVVVLCNGSPICMPWLKDAKAVLECYLSGQAGGSALWDVLFGEVNPSGKLAETFPVALEDVASSQWFPMGPKGVEYREGLYVGYRYIDKAKRPVLFPFGFGLSYTTFDYGNLSFNKQKLSDTETVEVQVTVTNSGNRPGKEIVQLYVRDVASTIFRPDKELKGFVKVHLEPGESKSVAFELSKRAFAYYNVHIKDWQVESGTFEVLIGASSQDIRCTGTLHVDSTVAFDESVNALGEALPEYYQPDKGFNVTKEAFERLYGKSVTQEPIGTKGQFHRNSTIQEIRTTWIGKALYKAVDRQLKKMMGGLEEKQLAMIQAMVNELPLRNLSMMSQGKVSPKQVDALVDLLNGKWIAGLRKLI